MGIQGHQSWRVYRGTRAGGYVGIPELIGIYGYQSWWVYRGTRAGGYIGVPELVGICIGAPELVGHKSINVRV